MKGGTATRLPDRFGLQSTEMVNHLAVTERCMQLLSDLGDRKGEVNGRVKELN